MATNNTFREKVLIVSGNAKLVLSRSDGFVLERNILLATGKIRVQGVNAITNWSRNLFFSGTNMVGRVWLDRYRATGTNVGAPGDTVLADPRFRGWQQGDFRFQPDSPALQLGIAPIDVSRAGPIRQ